MFFIVASFVMLFMAVFSVRVLFSRDRYLRYGLLLFGFMYLAVGARIAIGAIGHNQLFIVLAWVGYVSIGVVSMLFCAALVKVVFNTTGFFISKSTDKFSPSRREFLSNSLGAGMSLAVAPVAGYGVYRAVGKPVIKDIKLDRPGTHADLKGLKIVQLTDIHVGPTIGSEKVEQIVRMTNGLNPDLVLITGDLVDGSAKFISGYIDPLQKLKSTYGTYFVTGNHEYYSGAAHWVEKIQSLGIKVLNNSNDIISHKDANLMVAGVPDLQAENFGFEKYDPAKAKQTEKLYDFSIIMSHRPEIADEIAIYGYDLQLSGHTHGGQYFPWTYVIYLFHNYVKGLYKLDDMNLYVSQGTAYWGPPLRIGAESEITLITL